jgi:hypothetical protein
VSYLSRDAKSGVYGVRASGFTAKLAHRRAGRIGKQDRYGENPTLATLILERAKSERNRISRVRRRGVADQTISRRKTLLLTVTRRLTDRQAIGL